VVCTYLFFILAADAADIAHPGRCDACTVLESPCLMQAKEERIYEMQAAMGQLLSEKEGWEGPLQTQLQQQQEKCDRLLAALAQVSNTITLM
jgi:hypothetical protein